MSHIIDKIKGHHNDESEHKSESAEGIRDDDDHESKMEKLRDKLHDAKVEIIDVKHKIGKLGNLFNKNHRHDEEHEKETDDKRTKEAESHRFRSFAQIREGNQVKFYIDGRDYFWAVATALEKAKETIYIADWWLSPELFLRRPPAYSQEDRLDRILKRRAEAGVKIYVMVYKEVESALTCNSLHTKHALEGLIHKGEKGHGNIRVMRHPDHNVFENAGDMTFYWAHHEKFIVIDYEVAFMGGLDMCFGRWDLKQHPLADVHPDTVTKEVWPGQDYNNNRIMDFHNVDKWEQNELSKTEYGRMPWHDVSIGLRGNCILDIAEHFVGRWNFIKRDKYKRDDEYDWLKVPNRDDDLLGVQYPKHPRGEYISHPLHEYDEGKMSKMGTISGQIVRSSSDWSHGILVEHSIQNAYRELISNAKHYVYIENQFFITATGTEQLPIINTIGEAIVDAVVKADKEGRKFRVVVIMPSIPGFAGDLREKAANGTRAIMDYQYKSICRGEHSIFERVKAQGVDPKKYLFFFNLRTYDRLNRTQRIFEMEEKSGVKYQEVQHQHAQELFKEERKADSMIDPSAEVRESKKDDKIAQFEAARDSTSKDGAGGEPQSEDTVAENALKTGQTVMDETFQGSEELERKNYISEQLYIHAKVLIVDDEYLCIGSSNLNDRSQLGYHDSEMSIVIEDQDKIDIEMNGKPFKASKFVANIRRELWREHLGLIPPQNLDAKDDPNARPPGDGDNVLHEGDEDSRLVNDPLHDNLWNVWVENATENTKIFRELFHCIPDDYVKTFEDYDGFLPQKGIKTGHLFNPFGPVDDVKRRLADVRGHLVWMPMEFLINETMAERDLQVNNITESIFT